MVTNAVREITSRFVKAVYGNSRRRRVRMAARRASVNRRNARILKIHDVLAISLKHVPMDFGRSRKMLASMVVTRARANRRNARTLKTRDVQATS
jgi:hypothetical protein